MRLTNKESINMDIGIISFKRGETMGKLMSKKETELSDRLDEIYDRHNEIMKEISKLNKEWFSLRKEQEKILKKLGWW